MTHAIKTEPEIALIAPRVTQEAVSPIEVELPFPAFFGSVAIQAWIDRDLSREYPNHFLVRVKGLA